MLCIYACILDTCFRCSSLAATVCLAYGRVGSSSVATSFCSINAAARNLYAIIIESNFEAFCWNIVGAGGDYN